MTELSTFIAQGWQDHAQDARGVADRLAQALCLVADEAGLMSLVGLAHHVHGEHLGSWQEGIALIGKLEGNAAFVAGGDSGAACRRALASLRLSGGLADERTGLTPADLIRVNAMAAANLASRDTARAAGLLGQAHAQAQAAALPHQDMAHRVLASSANGIAATLEEKQARSADERALMLQAAEMAREYWALAGSWLEVERAEYRLALSALQAGLIDRARGHALACLRIVTDHDDVALEQFFGFEALARIERAAADASAFALALASARAAFARLSDDDRSWCRSSLDKLGTATSAPP